MTEDTLDELDQLLQQVCESLQLSPTQHQSAVDKYEAMGRWLGGQGSPLENFATAIYAQGSVPMGLTVRPQASAEYDIDLIFEVDHINLAPADLYRIVEARLENHSVYAPKLTYPPPARCLRLTYAGNFHLDIVPARRNPTRGKTAIEVPDRKLECWVPNDPRAYMTWFERRCSILSLMEKAIVPEPIPALVSSKDKPPLKRIVQLLKRHRDVVFEDCHGGLSSILLTTIAATLYQGEPRVVHALKCVLERLEHAVKSAWPQRISVPNPTNLNEDLCGKFSDEEYSRFVHWTMGFAGELRKLIELRGLDKIASVMKALFGEQVTTEVVKSYVRRLDEARGARALRYGAAGLSVTTELFRRHMFSTETRDRYAAPANSQHAGTEGLYATALAGLRLSHNGRDSRLPRKNSASADLRRI
jgi:Second Messenger Oligonucleotide or Dinucleotide Synthetase domain